MCDVETIGTRPGCVVLSIGAVGFDPSTSSISNEFYTIINRKSSRELGLFEDRATIAWWNKRSDAARTILTEVDSILAPSVGEALDSFSAYVKSFGGSVRLWTCGPDFDSAIIAHLYAVTGRPLPWRYTNNRCYRTLKNLVTRVAQPDRHGVHHNALDDARHQAVHAMQCLAYLSRIYKQEAYQASVQRGAAA